MNVSLPDLSPQINLIVTLEQNAIGGLLLLLLVCAVGAFAYLFKKG